MKRKSFLSQARMRRKLWPTTNDLRSRVEDEINGHIEPVAWERCRVADKAERESMSEFLDKWNEGKG